MPDINITTILSVGLRWLSTHGIRIVLIFIGTGFVIRILKSVIHKTVSATVEKTYKLRDRVAIGKREATLESVFQSTMRVMVWIFALLMILSETGINIGPLLAGAGIIGLSFGFGGQYLIRDLITGLFIILEDQYRKGDVVSIGGITGKVEDLNLRRTIIRDMDGKEHIIPNGEISITSNHTKIWSRAHLKISVSYDTDLNKAISVLNRVGKEMAEDEKWKDDFITPMEATGVDDFGESDILIKFIGDTKPGKQWAIKREVRKRIKEAFDKEEIEIPFPHRVVVEKRDKNSASAKISRD